jgi:hypothetical protein
MFQQPMGAPVGVRAGIAWIEFRGSGHSLGVVWRSEFMDGDRRSGYGTGWRKIEAILIVI